MSEGCGTTQHCVNHGWCQRCDPGFSALMSEVNVAIQSISTDEQTWGPLYAELGRLLGGGNERVTLAAELIEARRTNQRLNLRAQAVESKVHQYEKAVKEWDVTEEHAYIPHASLLAIAKAAGLDGLGVPRHLKHFHRVEEAEEAIERTLRALAWLKASGATGKQYHEAVTAALAVRYDSRENAVTTEGGTGLPPFSGDSAVCRMCSYTGAGTEYRAHGEVPAREEGTQSLGDVWPERLERECGRCRYQWDEALNPPA